VGAFAGAILVGTGLLMLPAARRPGTATSAVDALFTATSAVCVTGLAVLDTPTHWSAFGQVVILALIQLGGLGVTTFASVGVLVVSRRLGLRQRIFAQASTGVLSLGDVRRLLRWIVTVTFACEAVVTAALALRLWWAYDERPADALWFGLFHAVSAWNNAGFALYSDSLVGFVADPWVCGVVGLAVIGGGIGFPVILELWDRRTRPRRRFSLHVRLTLWGTAVLVVGGAVAVLAIEWSNPATLGPLGVLAKGVAALFAGVTPRTAGFNTLDYGAMNEASLLVTMVLMFVGGGSASAAGGIKVSTFAVIALVAWAEYRGDADPSAFRRRVPSVSQRQAVTIGVTYAAVGALATLALLGSDRALTLGDAAFESFSALSTVGLSVGITPTLGDAARLVLVGIMFVGRLGTITIGSALVAREQRRLFRYPEERPLVG
jgi:potassium uptake TrkH family protein